MTTVDQAASQLLGGEFGADADSVARLAGAGIAGIALSGGNLANVNRATVTTPAAATITAILAARVIRAQGNGNSGRLRASVGFKMAAAAADVVTYTVQTLTDAVAGTPLALVAATAAGNKCFTDDGTGAGITVTGGSAPQTMAAPGKTIGTAAVGDWFSWSGVVDIITPLGGTCLLLVSVTDSVAARAITEASISFEEVAQ